MSMVDFTPTQQYMMFPVSAHAQPKRLRFIEQGRTIYDLSITLDYDRPDYELPLDISRFIGKHLTLTCDEPMHIEIDQRNAIEHTYDGRFRPYAHFTARRGWLNDPNGLVFDGTHYHLYFQHNPVGCRWENMHWGHAISTDLIHWQEQDIALFPNTDGTMFSGCAIMDERNASGLGTDHNPAMLVYYTCAGSTSQASQGKPFTQNLMYSLDGGASLIPYANNPVVEQIVEGNRDPKVLYYAPTGTYLMCLYLDHHHYALLQSTDLVHWEQTQDFVIEDETECPDLFALALDGNEEDIRWVFIGASDRYLIGNCDGTQFHAQGVPQRLNYGATSYAAQSWSNMPDNRCVRIAFNDAKAPGDAYENCMTLPQEVTLRTIAGTPQLCVQPVQEIQSLYTSTTTWNNASIDSTTSFTQRVDSRCCDLQLSIDSGASCTVRLFGLSIHYDAQQHTLQCLDSVAPVHPALSEVSIRVVYDTMTTEIYAQQGSIYMSMAHVEDFNLNTLEICSTEATVIRHLSLSLLQPWWK